VGTEPEKKIHTPEIKGHEEKEQQQSDQAPPDRKNITEKENKSQNLEEMVLTKEETKRGMEALPKQRKVKVQ